MPAFAWTNLYPEVGTVGLIRCDREIESVEPIPPPRRRRWKRLLLVALAVAVTVFALMQAVPYGRAHHNPTVQAEPQWATPRTRELAVRACFDCHSNITRWPWYSNVAPISWLVQHDVDEGRGALNFSEWGRPQEAALEAAEAVADGSMPPRQYTLVHGSLSDADKQELAAGLRATFGG